MRPDEQTQRIPGSYKSNSSLERTNTNYSHRPIMMNSAALSRFAENHDALVRSRVLGELTSGDHNRRTDSSFLNMKEEIKVVSDDLFETSSGV